jgi:hypothetical protein
MEIVRLSPDTGEVLRRLNVFQGQILHGRVYKVEQIASTGPTQKGDPGSRYLLKIALGSQLIEAIVSEEIPEGSKVTLEVLKLTDESLVLKLLEVDSGTKPSPEISTTKQAAISVEPDIAELSVAARDLGRSILSPPQLSTEPSTASKPAISEIVSPPDWTGLPPLAAKMIRAAIAEGFLDPARFTQKTPEIRAQLQTAVENLETSISGFRISTGSANDLVESLKVIIQAAKMSIETFPETSVPAGELSKPIADALIQSSTALKSPSQPVDSAQSGRTPAPAPAPLAGSTVSTDTKTPLSAPVRQSEPSTVLGPKVEIRPGEAAPPAKEIPAIDISGRAQSSPEASRSQTPETGRTISQDIQARIPAPPAQPASTTVPASILQKGIPPASAKSTELPPAPAPAADSKSPLPTLKPEGSTILETSRAGDLPRDVPAQRDPEALFALRTLAALTGKLAKEDGLTVEQSAEISRHASRLTSSADALEGTILAPVLSRSLDIPDAIPRLLMNILFPGGNVELGVMQIDPESGGERRETPSGAKENRYAGILSLETPALGHLRVRLDYRESEDQSRVGGTFSAAGDTVDILIAGLPSLERSLQARGILTDGFRVNDWNSKRAPADRITQPRKGGLDIHA